ncbi:transposase [Myxococcus sp. MISCRS1]|uniref:transposase n=1 Tax=Myxococcus sp. MISCRS1 TaxID=2996786 RepID=UPI00227082A0|nr:transposase [Myxococcus sp. MISCRS1]MCY0996732.1 transposase [Myxococcus sp. MISCRS1]
MEFTGTSYVNITSAPSRLPYRRKGRAIQLKTAHIRPESRGGFSTKFHLTCERHRHVLSIALTAGQASDLVGVLPALAGVRVQGRRGRPRQRPRVLVGDRGYSFGPVRRWARAHHMRAVLPSRADPPRFNARCRARFDLALYRQSNVIERAVGHLKDKRAVGTRYDKLAVNDLSMVQVARIRSYLRHLHPSDRAWRWVTCVVEDGRPVRFEATVTPPSIRRSQRGGR